jgi:hypothetical protein
MDINGHFPLQGPPKFTQIGIFGFETNHPASLHIALAFLVLRVQCTNLKKKFRNQRKTKTKNNKKAAYLKASKIS